MWSKFRRRWWRRLRYFSDANGQALDDPWTSHRWRRRSHLLLTSRQRVRDHLGAVEPVDRRSGCAFTREFFSRRAIGWRRAGSSASGPHLQHQRRRPAIDRRDILFEFFRTDAVARWRRRCAADGLEGFGDVGPPRRLRGSATSSATGKQARSRRSRKVGRGRTVLRRLAVWRRTRGADLPAGAALLDDDRMALEFSDRGSCTVERGTNGAALAACCRNMRLRRRSNVPGPPPGRRVAQPRRDDGAVEMSTTLRTTTTFVR